MPYTWLLFDADGTLFDFERAEAQALQQTFLQMGLTYRKKYGGLYHQINAHVWREFEQGLISSLALRVRRFELLFEATGLQTDAELFSRSYLLHLARGADLISGAESTLRALQGRFHLALITNGLKDVQRPRLEASAIHNCFEQVIISEEVGAAKPDPRYFSAAFKKMGQPPPTDVLVIGDGLSSDILGANRFGLDACWFNPGCLELPAGLRVRWQIQRLDELVQLLGNQS